MRRKDGRAESRGKDIVIFQTSRCRDSCGLEQSPHFQNLAHIPKPRLYIAVEINQVAER